MGSAELVAKYSDDVQEARLAAEKRRKERTLEMEQELSDQQTQYDRAIESLNEEFAGRRFDIRRACREDIERINQELDKRVDVLQSDMLRRVQELRAGGRLMTDEVERVQDIVAGRSDPVQDRGG